MSRVFANYRDMFWEKDKPFWKNCYDVYVGVPIYVNADNEQDALDFAIDCVEKRKWKGLFLDEKEVEELEAEGFLEEYVCGGNHGLYLSTPAHEIIIKKIPRPEK
jgi:hypothetical protein